METRKDEGRMTLEEALADASALRRTAEIKMDAENRSMREADDLEANLMTDWYEAAGI